MFGVFLMRKTASSWPGNHICENFARNENVISPKESAGAKEKTPRLFGTGEMHHLFLLLPRMVASGLAACFMKAEGLMPTMFLNCLEKW